MPKMLKRLWDLSEYRVCADGGANRLYECTVGGLVFGDNNGVVNNDCKKSTSLSFNPDIIMGDLDSISCEVQEYYKRFGIPIVKDANQDNSDLEKCVDHILAIHKAKQQSTTSNNTTNKFPNLLIYGSFGGRLDQSMSQIHCLFTYNENFKKCLVTSETSLCFLLSPSTNNVIEVNRDVEGTTCGLIPVNGKTKITTSGLKWDVDGVTGFGGLVSTSNKVEAGDGIVTVKCDNYILWTTALL